MNSYEKNIPVHNLVSEEFQVNSLENGHPENFEDIHRHNFFEIIWFKEVHPDSRLELDFENYTVKNNQICIIVPGQVFNMKLRQEKGFVLAISKEIFKEACDTEAVLANGARPFFLDAESSETGNMLISMIRREYLGSGRVEILKAYLRAFCLIITDQMNVQNTSEDDKPRIQQLLTLIDEHYINQKNTDFYAEQLKISTHHLNDIVRLSRGTTVKKMISQRLILEAKRELSFGALTVKEIAFKLGFNDASYFSRFFKKHTNQNPDNFKNNEKR
ncbi:helix-turn-helix domain-containing protein [Chryseobacterium sp.]|jgi:AraC-like DNA-binding protein|uniref:helix-turn-helix domain-containing protein n=1 Tax=Chryseobacterium sp. TaxID=1871047 RepID=UPI00284EAE28|nr:helix-turn-helix domain-containing protein [Chryseobacterium sp.]MDR3024187.1 AraC family transcriptional regulator [Chryseobacterium sp.]